MLRVIQSVSASAAKSYYTEGLAREDYYLKGQEIVGQWGGRGAKLLGLNGDVDRHSFSALCENRNPSSGLQITARTRSNRTVGYDFNFNCPKSLSVIYALTQDERIMTTFRSAVSETMAEIEKEIQTRVRKLGREEDRTTGNMIWAEFIHLTARPVEGIPDPHLHAHCFAFNATYDDEERIWKAAQFRGLKRDAPYFEAAFHARLAAGLARIGFDIERTGISWEIGGVPKSAIRKFSRRTEKIDEVAKDKNLTDAKKKDQLGSSTREHKRDDLSMQHLRTLWNFRLDAKERTAISTAGKRPGRLQDVSCAREAVNHSLAHSFERASVVSEKRVLEKALRFGVGAVTVEAVHDVLRMSSVIGRRLGDERLTTTHTVLEEERKMVQFALATKGTCRQFSADPPVAGHLNVEQQSALTHVLTSSDRIIAIRGGAGVGKTRFMSAVAAEIESKGKKILAFAPTSQAARGVLRAEGFSGAETVAKLLVDKVTQDSIRGQVMWVDEAGLLSSRQLLGVFEIAKAQQARVILTGDTRQHVSVERGDALRILERAGAIQQAELSTIQRQKGLYREAVNEMAKGDYSRAFDKLEEMSAIREVPDEERYHQIAKDYARAAGHGKPVVVVSPTHSEAERVTQLVREELIEAGEIRGEPKSIMSLRNLGWTEAERRDPARYEDGVVVRFHQNVKGFARGERVEVVAARSTGEVDVRKSDGNIATLPLQHADRFQTYQLNQIEVAAGDLIRITENGLAADKSRLFNGAVYRVERVTARGEIRLDTGKIVGTEFGSISHAYCQTSHAAQGRTVDQVLIAQSSESWSASSNEQLYVSVSRGREGVTIYTDSRADLREAVERSSVRLSALELVSGESPRDKSHGRTIEQIQQNIRAAAIAQARASQRGLAPGLINGYSTGSVGYIGGYGLER